MGIIIAVIFSFIATALIALGCSRLGLHHDYWDYYPFGALMAIFGWLVSD